MKQIKKTEGSAALWLCLAFSFCMLLIYSSPSTGYAIGPNYKNVSVDAIANITNAAPEILNLTVEDPITLVAGSTEIVDCNVSLRDYNGGNTIDTVNATFFHSTSSEFAADDNNTHYSNSSCAQGGIDGWYTNYTCTFQVYYYAEPGEWNCSVFVNDTSAFNVTDADNTTVNSLLALNVTSTIDYGDLAINDFSPNRTANITNFGNEPINISVYGYGNESGDGLAMVCEQGNISISNERYAANSTADFNTKVPLTGTNAQIPELTMVKQTVAGTQIVNTTYWQLFVPPNPFGVCNGTVVFQAESST